MRLLLDFSTAKRILSKVSTSLLLSSIVLVLVLTLILGILATLAAVGLLGLFIISLSTLVDIGIVYLIKF